MLKLIKILKLFNDIFSLQEFLFQTYFFFFIILIKLIVKQYRNFIINYCYKYLIFIIRSC